MFHVMQRVVVTDGIFDGVEGLITWTQENDGGRRYYVETDPVIVGRHNYRDGWFDEDELEALSDEEEV